MWACLGLGPSRRSHVRTGPPQVRPKIPLIPLCARYQFTRSDNRCGRSSLHGGIGGDSERRSMGARRAARLFATVATATALVGGFLGTAQPEARADDTAPVVVQQDFTTSDGVALRTTLTS